MNLREKFAGLEKQVAANTASASAAAAVPPESANITKALKEQPAPVSAPGQSQSVAPAQSSQSLMIKYVCCQFSHILATDYTQDCLPPLVRLEPDCLVQLLTLPSQYLLPHTCVCPTLAVQLWKPLRLSRYPNAPLER